MKGVYRLGAGTPRLVADALRLVASTSRLVASASRLVVSASRLVTLPDGPRPLAGVPRCTQSSLRHFEVFLILSQSLL